MPLATADLTFAVNETRFFRDPSVFESLRRTIIPQLIARNAKRKEIRIWSAACSSGQEPYSIAILLRDHFPQLRNWSISIVASDLSEDMLTRTRSGLYSQQEISRGMPAKTLMRYFDRRGTQWQAKPELREMIEIHSINLARRWPYLGQFDLVLARNVLMYFDQHTKQDILKRLRGALRPEGYLMIGAAETLIGLCVSYTRRELGDTILYQPSAN